MFLVGLFLFENTETKAKDFSPYCGTIISQDLNIQIDGVPLNLIELNLIELKSNNIFRQRYLGHKCNKIKSNTYFNNFVFDNSFNKFIK